MNASIRRPAAFALIDAPSAPMASAYLNEILFDGQHLAFTATWFLLSLNPFFAAVISEVILIDEQSLWLTSSNLFGTTSFPLPSPWIIYVTFNLLLSTILIALSINFVKRTDR